MVSSSQIFYWETFYEEEALPQPIQKEQ